MIANLPFLTVVQLLGIDVFLGSFRQPDAYQCVSTYDVSNGVQPNRYLLLETPSNQHFLIQNGDTILYRTGEGAVRCEPVRNIALRQGTILYYTTTAVKGDMTGPIYETQILGKVTGTIDDNIWNAFCLQIWDFSIQNLNIFSYFGSM